MSDYQDILNTISTMTSALARGDINTVISTYTTNAVVLGEPDTPIQGKHAIKSMFASLEGAGSDYCYGAHEVVTAGDTALHLMKWTAPDPGGSVVSALSIAVLRKENDGSWKILIDHPFGDAVMHRNELLPEA